MGKEEKELTFEEFEQLLKQLKKDQEEDKVYRKNGAYRNYRTYLSLEKIAAGLIEKLKAELTHPMFWIYTGPTETALTKIGEPAVIPLISLLQDNYELEEIRKIAIVILGEIGDIRAVEPLIYALTVTRDEERDCVIEALGILGDKRAIQPLLQLLHKENEWSTQIIQKAITILDDHRTVDQLIKDLQEGEKWKRDAAIWGLTKNVQPETIDLLLTMIEEYYSFSLSTSESNSIVNQLEDTIKRMWKEISDLHPYRKVLLRTLDSKSNLLKLKAAELLILKLGEYKFLRNLLELGHKSTDFNQYYLVPSLKKIIISSEHKDELAEELLTHTSIEDKYLKIVIIRGILQSEEKRTDKNLLVNLLEKETDMDINTLLVGEMLKLEYEDKREFLISKLNIDFETYRYDFSEYNYILLLSHLWKLGGVKEIIDFLQKQKSGIEWLDSEAIMVNGSPNITLKLKFEGDEEYKTKEFELLLKFIKDGDNKVRTITLSLLEKIDLKDNRKKKKLIQVLERQLQENTDFQVKLDCIYLLKRLGGRDVINPLKIALADDDLEIRETAAYFLGTLKEKEAHKILLEALESKNNEIRKTAIKGLGESRNKIAVDQLIKVLEDENPEMRIYASEALGLIGDRRAFRPLIRLIGDEDFEVTRWARHALEKLGVWTRKELIKIAVQLKNENKRDFGFIEKNYSRVELITMNFKEGDSNQSLYKILKKEIIKSLEVLLTKEYEEDIKEEIQEALERLKES